MLIPVKKIRSLALIIATTSLLAGVGCLSGVSDSSDCNDSASTFYAGTWNGNFGGDDAVVSTM